MHAYTNQGTAFEVVQDSKHLPNVQEIKAN